MLVMESREWRVYIQDYLYDGEAWCRAGVILFWLGPWGPGGSMRMIPQAFLNDSFYLRQLWIPAISGEGKTKEGFMRT